MSELSEHWTDSQKNAWGYAQQGIGEGLSGRSALKQYRAGGGHIGNELWFSIYKTAYNIAGWKKTIADVPMTYTVRANMFTDVDMDFREEWVMRAKVSGFSTDIGKRVTKWVQVESDKLLTKQEWLWGMQQAVQSTVGSPPLIIDRRSNYEAIHRARNPQIL